MSGSQAVQDASVMAYCVHGPMLITSSSHSYSEGQMTRAAERSPTRLLQPYLDREQPSGSVDFQQPEKISVVSTTANSSFHNQHDTYNNPEEASTDALGTIPTLPDPFTLFQNALLRQPGSRRLFDHYLNRTYKILAICQGNKNPFIQELVPMALSDPLILNAMLAFSGVHYADLAGKPADEATWIHYGQAIQGQKFGLTLLAKGRNDTTIPLLVTAMLLCIIESFRVDAGALALQHLSATRYLLRAALNMPMSQISPETRAFLRERYIYTMILAHISMGSESDQWVLEDSTLLFPVIIVDSGRHPSIRSGCVHELFRYIPKVSVLARELEATERLGLDSEKLISAYLDLYQVISSWEPKSEDEVYDLCGKFYQKALLIYLTSTFERYTSPGNHIDTEYPPSIQQPFDDFIPFLQSIPSDSSISTTLCWPLAIFGSCARSFEHRYVICQRLVSLFSIYSAQSVRETIHLLDILWSQDDGSRATPLNFKHIMKENNITVLFL